MPWVLDPIPDLIPGQGAIAGPGLIPDLTRVPIQDLILDQDAIAVPDPIPGLIPVPTRAPDADLDVYTMKE